jgi:3-keto-disaccharide hydrolase
MKPVNVKVESDNWKGRAAVRVTDGGSAATTDGERFAILPGIEFQDGVIELELAGDVGPGAGQAARGFVGVVFRASDSKSFECFYLRPTNGRADDQVRRNHSAQYISAPDFPWPRLRKEEPEKYESYVDLVPGEWTKVKIEVQGEKARLYVHGSEQPTLIVNDLKHKVSKGSIALWIGPGTVAHFANLKVTR